MIPRYVVLLLLLVGAGLAEAQVASIGGVDSGSSARELIRTTDSEVLERWGRTRPWIRIRGLPDPTDPKREADVVAETAALGRLKEMGFRPVPFVRWAPASWANGVRAGGGQRLPLDLREAYQRARRVAETYGEVVTGLEFENEPDIQFVLENAETYAAFQKACYLGVRSADRRPRVNLVATLAKAMGGAGLSVDAGSRPLAIMAPLALPPGPFFEQLKENGFFAYTDAFNYHYYGYADDFSRVYQQFEDAVGAWAGLSVHGERETLGGGQETVDDGRRVEGRRQQREGSGRWAGGTRRVRRLPVMLTEYGFSGVTGPERFGTDVRVDQWRWFRSVGEQIRELRIAAPMAFYLRPYFERGLIEFGLTAPGAEVSAGGAGDAPKSERPPSKIGGRSGMEEGDVFKAGELEFRSRDFGVEKAEPWMARIGEKVAGNDAMPALAWLWDAAEREAYRPRDWEVATAEPSAVVIDLVAGAGLTQVKRYNGYLITATEAVGARRGAGEFIIYNFSEKEVRGALRWEADPGTEVALSPGESVTVAPNGRVAVHFAVSCELQMFAHSRLKVWFEPDDEAIASAVLATRVYPSTAGMTAEVLERFDHSAEASEANRDLLLKRPRASDEEALAPAGRWLVSPQACVEELAGGRWKIVGTEFSRGLKAGRTTVELPLADDFSFPEGSALRLSYRLVEGQVTEPKDALFLEIYFRTENGNLYVVWPWPDVRAKWSSYLELKDNYTMMFKSRANLPWRFAENRPVSLVFSFYSPVMAGATIEIDRPEIVRIER